MAFITNLNQLILHLAKNAPAFADRLANAGIDPESVGTIEDLNALPIFRKDDLARLQTADPPFGGFLACEPGQLKRIFQSPGPIYDPESRVADYWRWERALRAAGFRAGDIVMNAFGYHLTPAGAMFEEGLWAIGCTVIPGGVGNQESQVRALATLKATGYVGLPSYLNALLEKAAKLDLHLNLKNAFVTAEPLPPSLRVAINRRGINIRQGYGTAECGNLGYECEQEDGWHVPQDAIIQVCDLTTGQPLPAGESGEIVVTLFTADYALVRFGTGDLSSMNLDRCLCGRSSPRLMGWQGRVGDAVKVRGIFVHPHQLAGLVARFPEIQGWQGVITRQEHKDYLTLRIAPMPGVDVSGLAEQVAQTARETIRLRLEVKITDPEDIPGDAPPIDDMREWD